jgi:hypothetical protein
LKRCFLSSKYLKTIEIIILICISLGWSFEEVLPFFKISEDNQDYGFAKDTRHHAVGGLLPVSLPKFMTKLAEAFLVIVINNSVEAT